MVLRSRSIALLIFGIIPALCAPGAFAAAQGAVKLDNYTFDKWIGVPGQTVLVKFDESYAYGAKEDAFKELCKLAYTVPGFSIGEVGVQEYGDKENNDIAEKFGLKKEDFPAYFLFKGSEDSKVRYEGFPDPVAKQPSSWDAGEDGPWEPPMLTEINSENLIKWLRKHGIKMPFPGGIPELDALVKSFLTDGMKDADVTAAQALADGDYKENKRAAVYPKIMKKIKEKGEDYVATETARVTKVMAGKLTPEKKEEMDNKLKVLNVFANKQDL